MSNLPQQVAAVSPLGAALDGTGSGNGAYSVPGQERRPPSLPVTPPPSAMWACESKGCPRQFRRGEAQHIADHLQMHLTASGPRVTVPLTVTPELCAWWLANTTRRRDIREVSWRKIFMDLENGDWTYDGNPFGLDVNGNLVQGGHRATAIIAAGVDVPSALVGGLPAGGGLTMDTGRPQTFADLLKSRGVPGHVDMGSATTLLWRYENGRLDPRVSWNSRRTASQTSLMQFYEVRHGEIREAVSAARTVARVAGLTSRAAMAVAYIACTQVAPQEAESFFRALAMKGDYVPRHGEHDPIAAWRRKWGRQGPLDKLRPEEQLALTVKCWNAYVTGSPAARLVWYSAGVRAEAFPVPLPVPLSARDDDEPAEAG